MKKSLITRGNGWAIPTDKSLIKLLRVNPQDCFLEFTIKNKTLYIQEIKKENVQNNAGLIRQFSKVNKSWCLYLPTSIIELLEIIPEQDEIDIDINDNVLIIKK